MGVLMKDGNINISIMQFSKISGIKRNIVMMHIKENYPLFEIGKDKIDLHMALVLTEIIRKDLK